jgi:hypothetical protein
MPKSDATLHEDVEVFDMLERYCGWLVVGGLAIEVVHAFVFRQGKSFFEDWAPTIANAAVFGGVWLEIHFAGRAKMASAELDRRSNERVAQLELETQYSNLRAANAELSLLKYRAQRGVFEKERPAVVDALLPFAGTIFDACTSRGAEPTRCLGMLEDTLKAAGFVQIDWEFKRKDFSPQFLMRDGKPEVGEVSAVGIILEVNPDEHPELVPIAEAIAKAFTDAGAEAMAIPKAITGAANGHAIHLLIGEKA